MNSQLDLYKRSVKIVKYWEEILKNLKVDTRDQIPFNEASGRKIFSSLGTYYSRAVCIWVLDIKFIMMLN